MANRSVTIKLRNVGLDINNLSIYRNSISDSNLVAVVPKSIIINGYVFEDDEFQENYVIQADNPCLSILNLRLRATNQAPTVTISGDTTAVVSSNVTLTAFAYDPEGYPLTYLWSTGDTTQSITVTSGSAGTETYSVTVTDDLGLTASDSHEILWTAAPSPYVQIEGVSSAQINDTITLTGEDYNFTGSTWAWTGGAANGLTSKVINITETGTGTVTYGVTVDGTYTDTHDVEWIATPTTTTTTTTSTTTTTTANPNDIAAILAQTDSTTCSDSNTVAYSNRFAILASESILVESGGVLKIDNTLSGTTLGLERNIYDSGGSYPYSSKTISSGPTTIGPSYGSWDGLVNSSSLLNPSGNKLFANITSYGTVYFTICP